MRKKLYDGGLYKKYQNENKKAKAVYNARYNKSNKKKKANDDFHQLTPGASTTSPSALLTPKVLQLNGVNDQLRRSNRRQKARGEKEYLVDSTMLLRDLKVKVIS